VVEELHRPARRHYPRRHVDMRDIDDTWQADLVDMSAYAKGNQGYRFLLTVTNIFSKFAWAVPIKTKSGSDVTAAVRSVLRGNPFWCPPQILMKIGTSILEVFVSRKVKTGTAQIK